MLAKTLQVEAYDTAYGIANYDNRDVTGLDYVKMYPAEQVSPDSLLYDAIRKFGKRNIAKTFGLSLNEFMELPRDIAEHIMDVALEISKEKNNALQDLEDEMNDN